MNIELSEKELKELVNALLDKEVSLVDKKIFACQPQYQQYRLELQQLRKKLSKII